MEPTSRQKLLDAAVKVIRTKGYTATTVDDLCDAAKVSKGAFFHHFKSKEHMAVEAAAHFSQRAARLFSGGLKRVVDDPLLQLLDYIDMRIAILRGEPQDFTCLLGTMVQETFETHPAIRAACDEHISSHARLVEDMITAARDTYQPDAPWTAESLALHTQAVIQGAFILAKAKRQSAIAADSLRHLRRYIELLFELPPQQETPA